MLFRMDMLKNGDLNRRITIAVSLQTPLGRKL